MKKRKKSTCTINLKKNHWCLRFIFNSMKRFFMYVLEVSLFSGIKIQKYISNKSVFFLSFSQFFFFAKSIFYSCPPFSSEKPPFNIVFSYLNKRTILYIFIKHTNSLTNRQIIRQKNKNTKMNQQIKSFNAQDYSDLYYNGLFNSWIINVLCHQ